jgi:hypothetical protein
LKLRRTALRLDMQAPERRWTTADNPIGAGLSLSLVMKSKIQECLRCYDFGGRPSEEVEVPITEQEPRLEEKEGDAVHGEFLDG